MANVIGSGARIAGIFLHQLVVLAGVPLLLVSAASSMLVALLCAVLVALPLPALALARRRGNGHLADTLLISMGRVTAHGMDLYTNVIALPVNFQIATTRTESLDLSAGCTFSLVTDEEHIMTLVA